MASLAVLTSVCLLASGCDNTGGPTAEPDIIEFSFSPLPDSLTVNSSSYLDFRVTASPPVTFGVDWTLDGQPVALGPNFRFFPPDLGAMVLQAHAYQGDWTTDRQWRINVANTHPYTFSFDPPENQLLLVEGESRQFRVLHQWPFDLAYSWHLAGQVVGTDSTCTFSASVPGVDSLRVEVAADGQVFGQSWQLTVEPYLPPAVTEILVQDGPLGGSVEVAWLAVAPVVRPVAGYEVAASFSGPITAENWDQALHLGRFDHTADRVWMRRTFTEGDDGLIPGAQGWFTVRSIDDQGILSDLGDNADIFVAENWWVTGQIRNELGVPLAGVLVQDDGQIFSGVSDAQGWYSMGPFADHHSVRLRTVTPNEDLPGQPGTSWHDYRTAALSSPGAVSLVQDFNLLTTFGADPSCTDNQASFKIYFTYMTRTNTTTSLRPNQRLYKWAHYPLRVFIPEFVSEGGDDFRADSALALDIWNDSMGQDYFTQVDEAEGADVVFLFADLGPLVNGRTSLQLPNGEDWALGDVVPEKMLVSVNSTLAVAQRVQETALHELGHVLGLNRHALCNEPGYLMYVSAAGVLDDGPENAIHIDERRAVRTIRHLPQGWDMAGF